MGMFSNLLNRFDRRIEILDDLDDHWYFLPSPRPTFTNQVQDSETSQEGKKSHTVETGELKARNEIISLKHYKKSLWTIP